MRSGSMALLAFAIVAVAWAGAPAEAEWALDVYGGAAWSQSADLQVSGRDDTGATVDATIFDIKTDTGVTAGDGTRREPPRAH